MKENKEWVLITLKAVTERCFLKTATLKFSLFREEISACAAVHTCYVMDVCNHVWSKILLLCMVQVPFVPVVLTRLIVSELKHWVTWSHRTSVNFPFWGEKQSNTLVFLFDHMILTCFNLWCKLHLKNWTFLFAFKTFFKEIKRFLSYQICSLTRNLELTGAWWIKKETFLF